MDGIYIEMELLIGLVVIVTISVVLDLILFIRLRNNNLKLDDISEVLDDIAKGNFNRKILAKPSDRTSIICYELNNIVNDFRRQVVEFKKAEETNKKLMTSLSHDLRTPLTTLIGYLDAVQKGIVIGTEREQYIKTARLRAHDMKNYVDVLFEWFKLNSNEETFTIQKVEITELTRNLLKDWIPIFENISFDFDIDIPEKHIEVSLDTNAYSRIINNLIQNVITHSKATCIWLKVYLLNDTVKITVVDNGKGISKEDLSYIFERLYKSDKARSQKGSGLGLSIVKQLVENMGGTITVKSESGKLTEFNIEFPLNEISPTI